MLTKIRRSLTFANITSLIALTVALSTGVAYGANTIFSTDIVDGQVKTADLAANSVGTGKVIDGSLTGFDLHTGAVGNPRLATDAVTAAKVLDFSLSNQDVGVLFAQVNSDGTIANSSGGVTGIKLGTGSYQIDFARDISSCAFVSTQGEAGAGGASGGITGVTDRAANPNSVFATIRTNANAPVDRAFQLVVVC